MKKERNAFFDELVENGLFIPTGVAGFYGRGGAFEDVVRQFGLLVGQYSESDGAERIFFPPLVQKTTLERAGYMETMPHLCGVVHSFSGDEGEHKKLLSAIKEGEDWSGFLEATDLALTPAACYPLYPTASGTLKEGGRLVDLDAGYVFRREPSEDPARLQMFRQREMVRMGPPELVQEWRGVWMERGESVLRSLGLDVVVEVASDPFFGRGGRMLSASQKQQELKFEMQVPIVSREHPTAVTSFNYHTSHFGETFGILSNDGEYAHTACLGFGVERIALALFRRHGMQPTRWPSSVRTLLWP
ncbi:MAG: amino acid--[acyl-carrier-protein] ligase [Deltaproteobacteria bacterium]|nr:amino acid--[acyl-carrier-protein] ligase [Deltaproteobacteria bacterium]